MSSPHTIRTKLTGNNLIFTDNLEQTTTLGYSDAHITCEATTNVASGMHATELVRIVNNGEYKILSDFDTAQTNSVILNEATGEDFTVTLTAPVLSANTSFKFPPFLPSFYAFMQLDADPTKIKWAVPQQTPASEELAWEYGDVRQLWSVSYGDPFNDLSSAGSSVVPAKLPITRSSGRPSTGVHTTAANGLPFYFVQSANIFNLVVLRQLSGYQGIISWDQITSPVQWDFRASIRVDTTNATGGNSFVMFGNGTAENVSVTNGEMGGALANQSGGVAVEFDTSVSPFIIRIWEDNQTTGTYSVGMRLGFDTGYFRIFRVQRKDRIMRVEIISSGDTRFQSQHVSLEHTLGSSFEPTGTRWGIMGSSAGSTGLGLRTTYFEVRTYE